MDKRMTFRRPRPSNPKPRPNPDSPPPISSNGNSSSSQHMISASSESNSMEPKYTWLCCIPIHSRSRYYNKINMSECELNMKNVSMVLYN
ncbi:unnamed protein product [Cunninghamella echinulata]